MYEDYVVKVWEEEGYTTGEPYVRTNKHIFAPDVRGIEEVLFTICILPPGGQSSNHEHDRGEIIYIVSGRGQAIIGDEVYDLEPDMVCWAPAGVLHQTKNPGPESLKLATFFTPGYRAADLKKRIEDEVEADKDQATC